MGPVVFIFRPFRGWRLCCVPQEKVLSFRAQAVELGLQVQGSWVPPTSTGHLRSCHRHWEGFAPCPISPGPGCPEGWRMLQLAGGWGGAG